MPPISGTGNSSRSRSNGFAIRRVLVAGPPGDERSLAWARRALSGRELMAAGRPDPVALLSLLPANDRAILRYTSAARTWCTVTPVLLPGHDDHDARKTERLLRKSLAQAGFPDDLAGCVELDWRPTGFLPGLEHARRYRLPTKLQGPLLHVALRFPVPVSGALCLGAGRFRGLGLFASR